MRAHIRLLICTLGIVFQISTASAVSNTITVTDRSGQDQFNYPLQIGRPFAKGEIANYPQLTLNGKPLFTQADVKTRWPDGSVKHAILSLILPTLGANSSATLSFQNQLNANNTPLTKAEMLDTKFDFDAVTEIADPNNTSSRFSASARQLLENGDFVYWTSGPIATTVILADHSAARRYDLGFDSDRSFRPIFHATFWPQVSKVRVRYIGENSNTESLQDFVYNLSLQLGKTTPQEVYRKDNHKHFVATRWTKEFWMGGAPEKKISVDHNLAYLAFTYLFPNYDTALKVPDSVITGDYASWVNASKDLGANGWWDKYMGSPGGRPDIGPITGWTVKWLYTGDYRAREIAFTQADLAASWPLQVREGDPEKKIDRSQTISGLGRVISLYARPSLWLFDGRATPTPNDAVDIHGQRILNPNTYPQTSDGWSCDAAHQPDPFFSHYLLSGDYWYLEELQMWAAAGALTQCPGAGASYCRGAGAGIQTEVRGDAWMLRNRVNAAVASPDGSPERGLFESMTDDALALWEGQRNITGTVYAGHPQWIFGNDSALVNLSKYYPGAGPWGGQGVPPLHFWQNDLYGRDCGNLYPQGVYACTSPWMQNFMIMELGRTKELGYPSGPLFNWLGSNLVSQLTDPGFNHYQAGSYRMPVKKSDKTFFTSWAEVLTGYPADQQTLNTWPDGSYPECTFCYTFVARAAVALLPGNISGGTAAWNEINRLILPANAARLNSDPQWALIPRVLAEPPPAAPRNLRLER